LTPHCLSPLRKITDELFLKVNDNEIKTIVTQSQKHTGQNSVVNLKDQSSEFRKSSNISSVRMPEDGYEDAYDDSSMVEPKVKQPSDQPTVKPEVEEEKLVPREFRRPNAIQPRQPASVNNTDHMTRQAKNIDATTNTDMLSNDIESMEINIEVREKTKNELKSVSTNTQNQTTPRIEKIDPSKAAVDEIINELENDSAFFNNLSNIIGEKMSEKSSGIMKENVSDQNFEKAKIIRSVIASYMQSCTITKNNTLNRESENDM
jgi:hypothetical protein